jgi:aryl-phospho-beta-D-glucosidase BglC (GH1 family)
MNCFPDHKTILSACLLIFTCTLSPLASLHTKGKLIVDDSGTPVYLKGFGLGNWMVLEGYMWSVVKTSAPLETQINSPARIRAAIVNLIGQTDTDEFFKRFEAAYVTEYDIAELATWGVNSIRIPFNSERLLPNDSQQVGKPLKFNEAGFNLLDSCVAWCERYGVYVIIDMHCAPGSQNRRNHGDSDGRAYLWEQPTVYWPRACGLWKKIAARYPSNKYLAGYDLLNEPIIGSETVKDPANNAILRQLYVQITDSIRSVDTSRIIFAEGAFWAQDFQNITPPWDKNMVFVFHSYPPVSSQAALQPFDDIRNQYNVPLWHGETGDRSYQVDQMAVSFLESANVGWSWWCTKRINNTPVKALPYSVPVNPYYVKCLDYWEGRGPRPSAIEAREGLFRLADDIISSRCWFDSNAVIVLGLDPVGRTRVTHGPMVPVITVQPDTAAVELGKPASFRVRAVGSPDAARYQWRKSGVAIAGANGPVFTIPAVTFADSSGPYDVIATNSQGADTSGPAPLLIVAFDMVLDAKDFPWAASDFTYDNSTRLLKIAPGKTSAQVSAIFPGWTGPYHLILNTATETTGQPTFKLFVNGIQTGTDYKLPANNDKMQAIAFFNVQINRGDTVTVLSQKDGTANGFWQSVSFFPAGPLQILHKPGTIDAGAGKTVWKSDGRIEFGTPLYYAVKLLTLEGRTVARAEGFGTRCALPVNSIAQGAYVLYGQAASHFIHKKVMLTRQ